MSEDEIPHLRPVTDIGKPISTVVREAATMPGDPRVFHLSAAKLPHKPLVPRLKAWAEDEDSRCLYLHGEFKSGKTWLGVYAAMLCGASRMGYWSESRYVEDLERKRWYERMLVNDTRNDILWEEFRAYEDAFLKLTMIEPLVVDELFYWDLPDFKQMELDKLIKQRLDLGLVTVICGRKLPAPNSMLGRLLTEYAVIIDLPQLGA